MLRRSLGLATPVVLTLTSAPVHAGLCVTASSFFSANAFASRGTVAAQACSGLSPTEWARSTNWPSSAAPSKTFLGALGSTPLNPALPENAKLIDVLQRPSSVEAHVVAVWLNALRGHTAPPFQDGDAVKAVWANIRANLGAYKPINEDKPMSEEATLDWLAMTWQ